jgi:hypothetical protein
MMIMFVLFAALLAAKMMQPDIEIRYRAAPVPQINDVEVEKPVDRPVLSRQPSFEPLMRLNVFDRSREAVREMQLHNVDIAVLDDQSVKISVQGPMFFARGQADLQPSGTFSIASPRSLPRRHTRSMSSIIRMTIPSTRNCSRVTGTSRWCARAASPGIGSVRQRSTPPGSS